MKIEPGLTFNVTSDMTNHTDPARWFGSFYTVQQESAVRLCIGAVSAPILSDN